MLVIALSLSAGSSQADELDIAAMEFVDVVETVEGSIWKGVVTEQAPNVFYKIETADGSVHVIKAYDVVKVTKQRNPKYRAAQKRQALAPDRGDDFVDAEPAVATSFRPRNGMRIDPELAFAFPSGDLVDIGGSLDYRASFAPGARIGYELFHNNVGISFGAMLRWTSWRLPVEIENAGSHWTLETQAYGRAALQMGRAAPYAGMSLGLDTNHTFNNMSGVSSTAIAFGMNLQTGIAIAATPSALLELGVDYHPGTDTIEAGIDASISYFALRLGAAFRL
ncbi:MAG TPA: hypothetical protein VIV11_18555 [Kofleriaceae bacterium]